MGLVRQGEEARGLVVAFRLRVDEGDRKRRRAECHPHLMCPIPQHALRRSPGCHIVCGIKCHRNEDGSRVRASENGNKRFLVSRSVSSRIPPSLRDPPSSLANLSRTSHALTIREILAWQVSQTLFFSRGR